MSGRWYLKLVLVGAAVGASMELFMISTGFYEKVVVIEAQRRAEQVEATEELVLASQSQQQQQQQFRQEMMPSLQSTERQLEGSVVFRVGKLTFNLPDQTRNQTMDLWYVTGLGLEGQWLEDSMQQLKGLWILSFTRHEWMGILGLFVADSCTMHQLL